MSSRNFREKKEETNEQAEDKTGRIMDQETRQK
jgi:hypothetical protein